MICAILAIIIAAQLSICVGFIIWIAVAAHLERKEIGKNGRW